jgi:hypothetical protein
LVVFTDWTDERPPAPGFLRILHLGRILNDDDVLSSTSSYPLLHPHPPCHGHATLFSHSHTLLLFLTSLHTLTLLFLFAELNIPIHPPVGSGSESADASAPPPPPTIVHLSIRTVPPPTEEDGKKNKRKMSIGSSGAADDVSCHAVCRNQWQCSHHTFTIPGFCGWMLWMCDRIIKPICITLMFAHPHTYMLRSCMFFCPCFCFCFRSCSHLVHCRFF